MRKGRFAGLSDRGQEPVTPPELADLLLFDFAPAADEDDERAARERARTLARSPCRLLAGSHLLWSAVLLGGPRGRRRHRRPRLLAGLLAAILLLDLAALARPAAPALAAASGDAPHRRRTALATAALWLAAALARRRRRRRSLLVKAALIAGAGSAIPVFFTVPAADDPRRLDHARRSRRCCRATSRWCRSAPASACSCPG